MKETVHRLTYQMFEGSGASKKLAKQAAARAALTKLYNINFTPMATADGVGGEGKVAGTDLQLAEFSEDQSVADNIGRLVLARQQTSQHTTSVIFLSGTRENSVWVVCCLTSWTGMMN